MVDDWGIKKGSGIPGALKLEELFNGFCAAGDY